jgi:hypothetical protein
MLLKVMSLKYYELNTHVEVLCTSYTPTEIKFNINLVKKDNTGDSTLTKTVTVPNDQDQVFCLTWIKHQMVN